MWSAVNVGATGHILMVVKGDNNAIQQEGKLWAQFELPA
jgi:hypothetical protein